MQCLGAFGRLPPKTISHCQLCASDSTFVDNIQVELAKGVCDDLLKAVGKSPLYKLAKFAMGA